MTKPAVLQAHYVSYRPVPSRSVLQLTFEVPLETQEPTFKVLGYPTPGESTWVAIARLALPAAKAEGATAPNTDTVDKARTPFRELPRSQQAAIKVDDAEFRFFIAESYRKRFLRLCPDLGSPTDTATDALKTLLGIMSRKELDTVQDRADEWDRFLTSYDYKDRA